MICFIMDVIDNETGESIESICKKVTKAQNNLNIYMEKGYEMKCFGKVYDDIGEYELNIETMEELNLLKIEADEFDLVSMIETVKKGLSDEIDEENMTMDLRRSNLVDYIFLASKIIDKIDSIFNIESFSLCFN